MPTTYPNCNRFLCLTAEYSVFFYFLFFSFPSPVFISFSFPLFLLLSFSFRQLQHVKIEYSILSYIHIIYKCETSLSCKHSPFINVSSTTQDPEYLRVAAEKFQLCFMFYFFFIWKTACKRECRREGSLHSEK
ncbi:hypothetical protein ACOSQ3_012102 [Xanthoceras sorbifolium]